MFLEEIHISADRHLKLQSFHTFIALETLTAQGFYMFHTVNDTTELLVTSTKNTAVLTMCLGSYQALQYFSSYSSFKGRDSALVPRSAFHVPTTDLQCILLHF